MDPIDNTLVMPRPPRPRRRWLLIVGVVATLLMAGLAFVSLTGFEERELDASVDEPLPLGPVGLEPVPLLWQPEHEPPQPQEIPIDGAAQTGSGAGEPCPGMLIDELVVIPNPVTITHGNRGYVDIRNCADGEVGWTASTVSWVQLSQSQGSLASGAVFRVLFTVDTSGLPTGSYGFIISVNDIDVAVSGTKLGGLVAPGGPTPSPAPTVGGLIAPGLPPCAAKCITKAWLSTIPGRADVSIEVRTNTSARISVQVDPEPPANSNAGEPYYTDPLIHVSTPDYRRDWTTVLEPLHPETTYHIVVAALDTLGGTSYQTGTFQTQAVADKLAAGGPAGCSIECVHNAQLRPLFGTPEMLVEVRTLVPTAMRLTANGEIVADTGSAFVTDWQATLALAPGTSYEVVLRVTDEQGRSRTHSALVETPEPVAAHQGRVLVTFHQIHVRDDADNTAFNRTGELRFRFEVNGVFLPELNTGERKVRAPAMVSLDDGDLAPGRAVVIEAAPDHLPIRVQAQERDYNSNHGLCTAGDGIFPETTGRRQPTGCDFDLEWNTAIGLIDLHAMAEGGVLPGCFGFPEGVEADLCAVLPADGEDPVFDVFITIDFAD